MNLKNGRIGTSLFVANIEPFNNIYYSTISKNQKIFVNKSYIHVNWYIKLF